MFDQFAESFSSLDNDYQEDLVARANDLFDDYDFGDALKESSPELLTDLGSMTSVEQKKAFIDFLVSEGAIEKTGEPSN